VAEFERLVAAHGSVGEEGSPHESDGAGPPPGSGVSPTRAGSGRTRPGGTVTPSTARPGTATPLIQAPPRPRGDDRRSIDRWATRTAALARATGGAR